MFNLKMYLKFVSLEFRKPPSKLHDLTMSAASLKTIKFQHN